MDEQTTAMQETETTAPAAAAETQAQEQQAAGTEHEKGNAFQRFMEAIFKGAKDADASDPEGKKGTAAGTGGEKQFSQADVDAAIEAAKQKWAEEAAEAERVRKLSPEERAAEEQRRKDNEIADLRSQLLRKELQESAARTLEGDGFPVGLAGVLDYSSKEKMEESLANTTKIFKDSLAAAIQSRLKGKTPEGLGSAASAENMLKDQIAKNIRGI